MWRQGDVLIMKAHEVPAGAARLAEPVLAEGELTGHSHRVEDPATAELYEEGGVLYLRVTAEKATVVHNEHGPITLAKGIYKVWRQREYSPESNRRVMD